MIEFLLGLIFVTQVVSISLGRRSLRNNLAWLKANSEVMQWNLTHGYSDLPAKSPAHDDFLVMKFTAREQLYKIK